jgi:hypothetical protein
VERTDKRDIQFMTEQELRDKAKALGITSWHVKSVENLEKEIAELEAPKEDTPVVEVVSLPATETSSEPVMLVKQYKEGGHYREWTQAKDVVARLAQGWVKATT